MEFQHLVPTIVSFINRFLGCNKHCWLGERLLQTLDECLLPKVGVDYKLVAYFAIFDKIAGNITIPPRGLLELLTNLVIFLVKKHGPDTGLRSWSQGIKVLGICRTMMMHHHSSRLFLRLSRLLAFACLYFPDLEVRDNARYGDKKKYAFFSFSVLPAQSILFTVLCVIKLGVGSIHVIFMFLASSSICWAHSAMGIVQDLSKNVGMRTW